MSKTRSGKRILVIEDDETLNELLVEQLSSMGHKPEGALSWAQARAAIERQDPALSILDIRLPDCDGTECIPELAAQCPVVVLTAFGSIKQAVESMRAGAFEYLVKPVNPSELEICVNRALETSSLKRSCEYYRERLNPCISKIMVGCSPAFQEMAHLIELVAPSDSTVLIQGESGTGKELVAKSIHQLSNRASSNFVPVDSTTLQETLFESELFGHEKGAFTGADRRKQGLIEVAEGGTLFLDEIGELPANMQAKLLRVLESGEFRRVGGTQNFSSDIRFVAATNRDLRARIAEGYFRSDLYYRMSTVLINVPPLRERPEDIPILAEFFLDTRSFQRAKNKRLGKDTIEVLTAYRWPGNVRELRNVMERAILISGDNTLVRARDLGLENTSTNSPLHSELGLDHEPTLDELKKAYLARLVVDHSGHRAHIAQILGISERNTYRMLKKYGLRDARNSSPN